MRVLFLKAHSYTDHYLYSYDEWGDKCNIKVEKLLKKRYPSIKFIDKRKHMFRHFKFRDKADEALFTLLDGNQISEGNII